MRIPASGGIGVFEGVLVQVDRRVEVIVPTGNAGKGVSVRVGREVDVSVEVFSGIISSVGEYSKEISVLEGSSKGTMVGVIVDRFGDGVLLDKSEEEQAVRKRIRQKEARK